MPIRGYARDAGMWHMHHRVSAEERGLSMDAMKSQSQVAQDADQAQDLPFLRKKFQPPHMKGRYALVPESHITPQVMDLDAWSICLVASPAGTGKTALLSQWYDDCAQRTGCLAFWVSLDAHDASPLRFTRALVEAFAAHDVRFREETSRLKDSADAEALAITLVNCADVAFDGVEHVIIFIDGYEQAASPELDEMIAFFNRYTADNVRFVIAGTYIPSALSDLAMECEVLEFGAHDTQWDEERLGLLRKQLGLTQTDIDAIGSYDLAQTPQGLFFIRYALDRQSSAKPASEILRACCRRFFERELVERISPDDMELLICASITNEVSSDLCDLLMGTQGAATRLASLEHRNLFVVATSQAGTWELVPQLRAYLRDLLLEREPAWLQKLAMKTANWYQEQNDMPLHGKYLAMGVDPFYLESTVEGSTGLTRPMRTSHKESPSTLYSYLLSREADDFLKDPYLAWVAVWSCVSAGDVRHARCWLDQVRSIEGDNANDRPYRFADALCIALEGDSARSLEIIQPLLDEEENLPLAFNCLLNHMAGENLERLGRVREGRDMYLKAYSLAEHCDTPFYRLFDLNLLAQYHFYIGDFEEAEKTVKRGLALCGEETPIYGSLLAVRASILIERHELEPARLYLEEALACVSTETNLDMYVDVQMARARLRRVEGNRIAAFEIASDTVDAMEGKRVPRNMDMRAYALKAALAAELDEMSMARACEDIIDGFMDDADVFRSITCAFAKARMLWHGGRREECLELLERKRPVIDETGSIYFATQLAVLCASYHAEMGHDSRAMVELSRSVELAMHGGFKSVFLEGRTCMHELLLQLATSRKSSYAIRNHAKSVLLLFDTEDEIKDKMAFREGAVQGYYSLTEREREILQKLNSGMTRTEIALSLSVSQNTVKTHLKNIYSKLGVHTRSEAYRASSSAGDTESPAIE